MSMNRSFFLPIAFGSLLVPQLAAATKGWDQLKTGMTPAETLVALGKPLIQTAGPGFSVWIYDSKAEVVFHDGPIMAWTIPTPNPLSEARPLEMDLPLGPSRKSPPVIQEPTPVPKPVVQEPTRLPTSQFRYKVRD